MERCILVADIGGTNPRLAMMTVKGLHSFELLYSEKLDNNNSDFAWQVNVFLRTCSERGWTTATACFSVAGPVINNACHSPVHAKFAVDGNALVHQTALRHVVVINDFEAIGHGIAVADLTDRHKFVAVLHPDGHFPSINPHGNRAIIGPGTGLGVAYLPRLADGHFLVVASEGGHASAPLHSKEAMELATIIGLELGAPRIDTEAIVSGPGLRRIASFLLEHPDTMHIIVKHNHELQHRLAKMHETVSPATIARALAEDVPTTTKDAAAFIVMHAEHSHVAAVAMHVFFSFLGDAAHDIALHGLATGGLIIAGGIAAKNREALVHGPFMHSFLAALQPGVRDLVKRIPVFISLDYDVSFFGCARKALVTFPE